MSVSKSKPLPPPAFGTPDLRLPNELRAPFHAHLGKLREHYKSMGWAQRVGFGERAAVIVIDLARCWTESQYQLGSCIDSVVNATCRVLTAARKTGVPVFFTTTDYDPNDPPSPHDGKLKLAIESDDEHLFDLDPRLEHQSGEKVVRKKYASAFKATNLHEMLTATGIDTLIITGVSTSHCVYATCRDGTDSFRIIVPAEAVGERCEIMHEVNLLDIDIDLGDVMPVEEVIAWIRKNQGFGLTRNI